MSRILLFNKPYGVICQFSRDGMHPTLADYISLPDFYPAGRLDTDSEGLVLLTDDGELQHRITDPKHKSMVEKMLDIMATYKRYEDVITIGAYKQGTNPKLDYAIKMMDEIKSFLKQEITEKVDFAQGLQALYKLFE